MNKDDLLNIITCGDITFTINDVNHFIKDTSNGWIAYELPDGKMYGPYEKYDDLLDNFMIGNKPLRNELVNITDW